MPTVFGAVADDPIETGTQEQLDQEGEELSQEDQERADKRQNNNIIGLIMTLAPYLAIFLGAIGGAIAGLRASGDTTGVLITAGAGAFAGVFLFVFLSTALAALQWAPIETSSIGGETTERIAETQYGALLANSLAVGVIGAIAGAGVGALSNELDS
jgi:hypothetical protein